VSIGNVIYLHRTTPAEVKAKCVQEKCVQEKTDYFCENQYIDCLARKGR